MERRKSDNWSIRYSVGGLSNRAIQYLHMILSSALRQAVRREIIRRNPAAAVSPPKKQEQKRIRYWKKDQVDQFLASISTHRLRALYRLAIMTGMR